MTLWKHGGVQRKWCAVADLRYNIPALTDQHVNIGASGLGTHTHNVVEKRLQQPLTVHNDACYSFRSCEWAFTLKTGSY